MVSVTTKLRAGISILAKREEPAYGSVTSLCGHLGLSRSAAYQAASLLEEIFDGRVQHSLRTQLQTQQAEIFRLRQELAFQKEYLAFLEEGPTDAEVEAFVLEAAAAPVSLRKIPALLKRAFGIERSHTWVKEIIDRYAAQARAVFQKLAPHRLSRQAALDEIFLGRTPLLTGVDLDSLALILGQKAQRRDATTWKALLQTTTLELAISDKARGIKAALELLGIPSADDLFHFKRLLRKALRRMEAHSYARIEQEYALEKDLKRRRARGQDTRGVATHYARVKAKVWEALGRFDAAEKRVQQIEQALEVFDAQGNLPTLAQRKKMIEDALARLAPLGLPRARQITSYVQGWGILKFAQILDEKLAGIRQRTADPVAVGDAMRWVWLSGQAHPWREARRGLTEGLSLIARWQSSPLFWQLVASVRQAVDQVRRASSAVETVNSILRVYQMVKKDFSDDYFYLIALHYNMRPFEEGTRKGKTPFELLGLKLPTRDWIELLRSF